MEFKFVPPDISWNSEVVHLPSWLVSADEALQKSLELPWEQNFFKIYGKPILLPRREIIFGDRPYTYSYSKGKVVLTAKPWPDWLKVIRDAVERHSGYRFPLVIGNRYDSGDDHIGWHDDGRPELGSNPAIASLSLGQARKFQIRAKGDRTPIQTYKLHHGDLLIMQPGFQGTHLHRVPKEKGLTKTRVNWTFRPWSDA